MDGIMVKLHSVTRGGTLKTGDKDMVYIVGDISVRSITSGEYLVIIRGLFHTIKRKYVCVGGVLFHGH